MNIYIGNLSYEVKEVDLQKIMEEYGAVKSAKLITDRMTGRSKGFGFVEMENNDEALNAIKELSGKDHLGRPLVINEALPRN